jgi:hypothetical protein
LRDEAAERFERLRNNFLVLRVEVKDLGELKNRIGHFGESNARQNAEVQQRWHWQFLLGREFGREDL